MLLISLLGSCEVKKYRNKKGKVSFTFLHHYLTPEAGTVKKDEEYWLVIMHYFVGIRNSCINHWGFFQPSCNKFLLSISPMCCIAEGKICISRYSPGLTVRMTLLTGFALTPLVCADKVYTRGFVIQSKMDHLLHSWTLLVAACL